MTGAEIAAIITAFIGGVGGLVIAISNARQSAKKSDLDALGETIQILQIQLKSANELIKDLQRENIALHERDNQLGQENARLRGEVQVLREENAALKTELEKRPPRKQTGELKQ